MLGRLEYQKGNYEAALHVFGGIDMSAITPKMKASICRRCQTDKRHSQSDAVPSMSMHAVSLLLEAVFLKAKSLQTLGRFQGPSLIFFLLSYFYLCLSIHVIVILRFALKSAVFLMNSINMLSACADP